MTEVPEALLPDGPASIGITVESHTTADWLVHGLNPPALAVLEAAGEGQYLVTEFNQDRVAWSVDIRSGECKVSGGDKCRAAVDDKGNCPHVRAAQAAVRRELSL